MTCRAQTEIYTIKNLHLTLYRFAWQNGGHCMTATKVECFTVRATEERAEVA